SHSYLLSFFPKPAEPYRSGSANQLSVFQNRMLSSSSRSSYKNRTAKVGKSIAKLKFFQPQRVVSLSTIYKKKTMAYNIPEHLTGLSEEALKHSRKKFGLNDSAEIKRSTWFQMLLDILKEPMLVLLIAVTVIYVIVGNYSEAMFMLGAIIAVSGISFYQDNRSKKALEALEKLNEPLSAVIRDSKV